MTNLDPGFGVASVSRMRQYASLLSFVLLFACAGLLNQAMAHELQPGSLEVAVDHNEITTDGIEGNFSGKILSVNIAAHSAQLGMRHFIIALYFDVSAHGVDLDIGSMNLAVDISAYRLQV